jgi:hypothetical protein
MNAEPKMIPVPPHTFGGGKDETRREIVRREQLMQLAENGITGRAARRRIAQAENRAARRGR